MTENRLIDGLGRLPSGDKTVLLSFVALAVVSLGLGVLYGALTAFVRAGFLGLEPGTAYKVLTLHGVTIFFYWLYFIQAALVLVLSAVYTEGAGGIRWRGLTWLGFVLMTAGFIANELVPLSGVALLYNASPDLVQEWQMAEAGYFYLGYLLLGTGLFVVAVAAAATVLTPRFAGWRGPLSTVSFAALAWSGLLMVSGIAALNTFVPAVLWAFGLRADAGDYNTSWMVMFHNVHYLPLMATVVLWYVLVEEMTRVRSIFGANFSKIAFASYLILVPPTSLYHMFLEPNLAEVVKVGGSLLSLFISVPTVLVFLVIVVSLEVSARAHGGRGLFGWMRLLPWRNPVMAAIGMAAVNLAIGGAFAFVLIQERFAPLISDTFFIPAYFHFLTVGTVSLTMIAALFYVLPGLTGHALWRPLVLARLPYFVTLGLTLFGGAGLAAGFLGAPRRVFDVTYQGGAPAAWAALMPVVGVGAAIMAVSLAVYVYGLVRMLMGGSPLTRERSLDLASVSWGDTGAGAAAWTAPIAVVGLALLTFALTSMAFELLEGVPLVGIGGH